MSKIEDLTLMLELADDKTPRDKVIICRQVLEKAVDLIFEKENVRKPFEASLLELINNETVQGFFGSDVIIDAMHFVRIVGINAHHDKHIKTTQAQVAMDNTKLLLEVLEQKLERSTILSDTTVQPKVETEKTISYSKMNEFSTRKVYIDLYLGEAGWEVVEPKSSTVISTGKKVKCGNLIPGKACSEIMVKGLPTESGIGFCDYVLYNDDGKPLAIVEAKKTSVDPHVGQQQVIQYGKCMKEQYGYTPVLYFTNGYQIYVIDGIYPPRQVAGFHTKDELSYLMQKRNHAKITDTSIRNDIAGRPYQMMAISSISERFNNMHRRGLLVMATGTGKTRTAIALVELLTRHNYVKNVLFLADRRTLVRQAFKNFNKLLPNMTYCVLSETSLADDTNARITFSTHQTMINYIDSEDKRFSIGRFDLIIIDEAHRSIFNKYGAIFSYFDSLLVGLTATPKDEVDANTYDLFGCESGMPNFSYSLKEAVNDQYLVPYKLVNRTTTQLAEGLSYDSMSKEDQDAVNQLTNVAFEPGSNIESNLMFRKIYNKDTCRKVLEDLMTRGIKVNQGQTLGKSIIFAVNHFHAQMVVDTFYEMYPMYKDYCRLVDNQVKNSTQLVDEFGEDDSFRIAVSVDMLDTGVDVPAVLNLVFFKRVNSNIKLIQMIGRGTRTCEGLLDGQDKKCFYIFDYFNNLKDENVDSIKPTISITQKIFGIRLNMLCELQTSVHQSILEERKYYFELKDILMKDVKRIKDQGAERLSVRAVMATVDKFYDDNNWQYISDLEKREIEHSLLPLVMGDEKEDYLVYAFDRKMLEIELKCIKDGDISKAIREIKAVRVATRELLKKSTITDIFEKIDLLKEFTEEDIWESITVKKLEFYRKELRSLMVYLKTDTVVAVMIDEKDEVREGEDIDNPSLDIRTYKEKVIDYLVEHSTNSTIQKIKNLEPLRNEDFKELEDLLWVKLGTKEDYYSISKLDNLAAFIRSLVGIDQNAINQKFSEYINENSLSAEQMEFIYSIINYVRENGDISGQVVVEESPFDQYSVLDLFGNNVSIVTNVVNTLHDCIAEA